jgi:hypothetical protein
LGYVKAFRFTYPEGKQRGNMLAWLAQARDDLAWWLWATFTFPDIQARIGKVRLYRPGGLALQHRCPQRASLALRIAHPARPRIVLPARCPRQAAQAHNVRFAQMRQSSGQISIHGRQGL